VLEIRHVRFAYAGPPVVDGVDLTVARGEIVAVVGPNGAGKSTLLRLASGLLEPQSGEICLDGEPVRSMPRRLAARRIAGVVADADARFPFTVRDTVALGRHPWRGAFGPLSPADQAAIDEALAAAELTALADRPLPSLSSGERQRAALARCLVQGGDLVLLDEPTAHLDLGHRLRMLDVLRARARASGRAVLAVLHDLNLAGVFADRVVLLVAGRVAADGPPAEVFTVARIREAFGAEVAVLDHPQTGDPVVVPLGGGEPA
jgi:iron complex transport system ATP-binding protein